MTPRGQGTCRRTRPENEEEAGKGQYQPDHCRGYPESHTGPGRFQILYRVSENRRQNQCPVSSEKEGAAFMSYSKVRKESDKLVGNILSLKQIHAYFGHNSGIVDIPVDEEELFDKK